MESTSALPIQAGFVFIGIFAILLFASLIGNILKHCYKSPNSMVNCFNTRLYSWWVITIILLFAFWFGHIGTTLLFMLISFAALREFMTLVYRRRSDYNAVVACFYIVLPLQYYFILINWYSMFTVFIPVYVFLILPIISSLSEDIHGLFFQRTAKIQWGTMITIFCLSHVPALMNLEIRNFEGRNILLLLFMIVVVQGSDALQYLWGKVFKKRCIMPLFSADKTLGGTIVGILSATILAAALYWLTPFSPIQAAAIGLLLCIMGFFGGLVMDAIKYSFGVTVWGRPSSKMGMIDRVDSICFAAPIFFHIVRYCWT